MVEPGVRVTSPAAAAEGTKGTVVRRVRGEGGAGGVGGIGGVVVEEEQGKVVERGAKMGSSNLIDAHAGRAEQE